MPEAALPLFERLGPSMARWRGWLHERSGERALAIREYERAVAWNPRDSFARDALARLRRKRT